MKESLKSEIIEKIKNIHPELKIIDFNSKFITVQDRYGLLRVQYYTLLDGNKPVIHSALDKNNYFRKKLKEVQPDLEFIGEYINSNHKVQVKDKYGICESLPSRLLKGAVPCIETSVDKNKYFINQCIDIHDNKYDYSKVKYKNNTSKVEIICYKHGSFFQSPQNHLQTKGCLKCAWEDKNGTWYKNPKNKNKKSNFYILKIEGNNESFLKYGASVNIKRRISDIINQSKKVYKVTVIKTIETTVENCNILESKAKKRIKDTNISYKPLIKFCGKNECFKPKIK